MISAEEFEQELMNSVSQVNPDWVAMIKRRDLENRIAGLREAAELVTHRYPILDRITELEKELKP